MGIAIEVKSLSVLIDKKQILKNINLTIPKGKIVGIIGPSGAGKTTLIRSLLGLQKPSSGQAKMLGLEADNDSLRSKVGYVTQSPSVYPDLTVRENVEYFAKLLGVAGNQVNAAIKTVDLGDQKSQVVSSLSGGQKARVSLAVALLGNPEILLLDEPTVGLDPVLRQRLWSVFADIAKRGTTIIITSHVMDEADKCDQLAFIRDGQLLIYDVPAEIKRKTKTKNMEDAFLKLSKGDRP